MALYLQMDGVDDWLKAPSITFDEVIMVFKSRQITNKYYIDARAGAANTYIYRNSNGQDIAHSSLWLNGMYWNDVKGTNVTGFIPYDTKGTLRLVLSASATDDVNFFSNNGNGGNMSADVFSIKLLLGGVLKAHYDMSTGTVQDQSGNGNHATLTGGTFVDDGTGGGGTGTAGSISYSTKNIIYRTSSNSYDSKQSIYQTSSLQYSSKQILYSTLSQSFDSKIIQYKVGSTSHDTKNIIYNSSLFNFNTKQIIYNNSNVNYPTKQSIYKASSTLFDTLQQLIDGGLVGSLSFDTKLMLYANGSKSYDNKQIIYQTTSSPFATRQSIFRNSSSEFSVRNQIYRQQSQSYDLKQIIHKLSNVEYQLKQVIYSTSAVNYDTLQQLLSDYFVYSQVLKYELSITNKLNNNLNINDLPMMYQVDILRKLQSETGISSPRKSFDLKI